MKKLAVVASGSGSNFENIVHACRQSQIAAEVVGLITDNPEAGALERAQRLGIPSYILKDARTPSLRDFELMRCLQSFKTDFVVLAGYLKMIGPETLKAYPQRVVNIHPSLLPKFGGKGMYGQRVFEAVLAAGETKSGVTVHFVDEIFDHGQPILQQEFNIEPGETVDSLAKKTHALEHRMYVSVLAKLCR